MKHYTYEIINELNKRNNINPFIYIGVRSCKTDPEKDDYYGSSTTLKEDITFFGKKHFTKRILNIFDDRKLAEEDEYNIHKENDVVKNEKYYNLSFGSRKGNTKSKNLISAIDIRSGKKITITRQLFEQSNNYTGVNKNKVNITNGILNNLINISEIENIPEGWKQGKTISKICITNSEENKFINKIDLDFYINNGWRKGRTNFKKHKIWCNNGIESKMVEISDIPYGWKQGRHTSSTKNKIAVFKNGETKYIFIDELDIYINDGWSRNNVKRKIWINNGIVDKFIFEDKYDDFLKNDFVLGKLPTGDKNKLTGRIIINDGVITKMIVSSELEKYKNSGWKIGRLQKD